MSETTYTETPTFVTRESYDTLFKEVETFRAENVRLTNRVQSLTMDAKNSENTLATFIRDNYASYQGLMTELAEIMEIELTKSVSFNVNVTFEGSATVPFYMNADAVQEAIEGNFQFSAEYQGMELDEVYVDEVDSVFSGFEED